MEQEILTREMRDSLKESFKLLKDDVHVLVFSREGSDDPYGTIAVKLVKELAKLEPKIKVGFHSVGDSESKKYGVERAPTLLICPEKYSIRFTGAPLGEEGRSLVMSIIMASTGQSGLSEDSKARLKKLDRRRHVRIFTSPT